MLLPSCDLQDVATSAGFELDSHAERVADAWIELVFKASSSGEVAILEPFDAQRRDIVLSLGRLGELDSCGVVPQA